MNSVFISGNVMLALRSAIKLKSNSVTFGYTNNCIAVAVEDIIGTLAIFTDNESTHADFVIRLPREIMAEVVIGGYMQVCSVDDKILSISIFKDRDCNILIKHSKVAKSYSMDFGYLYEQINPKSLIDLQVDCKTFSSDTLPVIDYIGESVYLSEGFLSAQGKGIMFYKKISEHVEMTVPATVFKGIVKSINPNTLFYKNKMNTYLAQNGTVYTVWRGEYQKHKFDLNIAFNAEPLAEYKVKFPEIISCGNTSTTLLKDNEIEINFSTGKFTLVSDLCYSSTNIKVEKVSATTDIKTVKFPAKLLSFFNNHQGTIKVYSRFIRIEYADGILDIGGTVSV